MRNVFALLLFCMGLLSIQSIYHPALAQTPSATGKSIAGEVVSVRGLVFIRQDGRDSKAAPIPAKPGDTLYSNDIINTSNQGSVKILLKDKSIIDVGPSALFKMDKYEAHSGSDRVVEMNMLYGSLRGAVTQKVTGKGKFHLKTPTSTMGVRGTEFLVKSELKNLSDIKNTGKLFTSNVVKEQAAAKTEIIVLQGQVEVAKSGRVLDAAVARGATGTANAAVVARGAATGVTTLTTGTQITTQMSGAGEAYKAQKTTLTGTQIASISSEHRAWSNDNTFNAAINLEAANNNANANKQGARGPGSASHERGAAPIHSETIEGIGKMMDIPHSQVQLSGTAIKHPGMFNPQSMTHEIRRNQVGPKRVHIVIQTR